MRARFVPAAPQNNSGGGFSGKYDDLSGRPDLNKKLDVDKFKVLNSLPGLPVTDVAMAYLPALSLCKTDGVGKTHLLIDPLTGNHLTQDNNALKPTLKVDDQGRSFLRFEGSRLMREGVNAALVGGDTGKTTSFMLVVKTKAAANQNQFNWVQGEAGSYHTTTRLGVHFPWSDGTIYIDHAAVNGGRLQVGGQPDLAQNVESWFYERDGATARLWRGGNQIGSTGGLHSALSNTVGRFTIGDGNGLGEFADMDFYGLFFYNRVLTDAEKQKMFLFSKMTFRV